MATITVENFSDWLSGKLKDLNTDESIFGDYITGILDSDETVEEKNEALYGILGEIVDQKCIEEVYQEIVQMWNKFKEKEPPPNQTTAIDVDLKLSKLMETQSLQCSRQREYTEDEKKIREAILSQYSQMSDEEENEVTEDPKNLQKNTNASTVAQAEREKREQAKQDSQKKKEKDKEDREKQKQLKEEKKEKRKTQKGERKR